jgi:hypothetical protein
MQTNNKDIIVYIKRNRGGETVSQGCKPLSALAETVLQGCKSLSARAETVLQECKLLSARAETVSQGCKPLSARAETVLQGCKPLSADSEAIDSRLNILYMKISNLNSYKSRNEKWFQLFILPVRRSNKPFRLISAGFGRKKNIRVSFCCTFAPGSEHRNRSSEHQNKDKTNK